METRGVGVRDSYGNRTTRSKAAHSHMP